MIIIRNRRRLRLVLSLVLCLWPLGPALLASVPSQEDEVRSIRELYARTNESIRQALAKKPGESELLYCNELITNRYGGSWRAVGNYSRKVAFWYSDQPEFARYENVPEESVLVKVEVQETAAVQSLAEEYLFDKGELVFYFRRSKAGDSTPVEERLYFHGTKLVRRLGEPTAEAFAPTDPDAVLKRAKALQMSFLATFD